jgi:hypothetical protein
MDKRGEVREKERERGTRVRGSVSCVSVFGSLLRSVHVRHIRQDLDHPLRISIYSWHAAFSTSGVWFHICTRKALRVRGHGRCAIRPAFPSPFSLTPSHLTLSFRSSFFPVPICSPFSILFLAFSPTLTPLSSHCTDVFATPLIPLSYSPILSIYLDSSFFQSPPTCFFFSLPLRSPLYI